ncbi:hypothetical protein TNCV_4562351 [Trichonephila clavipes]|nr:hypothetical protein TNCV_4562351 [Trichonephila clavipes]
MLSITVTHHKCDSMTSFIPTNDQVKTTRMATSAPKFPTLLSPDSRQFNKHKPLAAPSKQKTRSAPISRHSINIHKNAAEVVFTIRRSHKGGPQRPIKSPLEGPFSHNFGSEVIRPRY